MDHASQDISDMQAEIKAIETIVLAMFKLHPDRQLILTYFREWSIEQGLLSDKSVEGRVRKKLIELFEKQGF
jgi:hypothetical protein